MLFGRGTDPFNFFNDCVCRMLAAFYDGGDFYHFLKGKVAGDLAFSPGYFAHSFSNLSFNIIRSPLDLSSTVALMPPTSLIVTFLLPPQEDKAITETASISKRIPVFISPSI